GLRHGDRRSSGIGARDLRTLAGLVDVRLGRRPHALTLIDRSSGRRLLRLRIAAPGARRALQRAAQPIAHFLEADLRVLLLREIEVVDALEIEADDLHPVATRALGKRAQEFR